jgi:hypothetical protein
MKTLKDCKDEVAKRHGAESYENYYVSDRRAGKQYEWFFDEVAELYASHFNCTAVNNQYAKEELLAALKEAKESIEPKFYGQGESVDNPLYKKIESILLKHQ